MDRTEIERLKRAIGRERQGVLRPGVAFSRKLRAKIVAHVKGRLQRGEKVAGIAASLGIKYDTLRYWVDKMGAKRADKPTRFRRVRVVTAPPEAVTGVTLFGPGGTRIDGLSLNQAAELLRRMS